MQTWMCCIYDFVHILQSAQKPDNAWWLEYMIIFTIYGQIALNQKENACQL